MIQRFQRITGFWFCLSLQILAAPFVFAGQAGSEPDQCVQTLLIVDRGLVTILLCHRIQSHELVELFDVPRESVNIGLLIANRLDGLEQGEVAG